MSTKLFCSVTIPAPLNNILEPHNTQNEHGQSHRIDPARRTTKYSHAHRSEDSNSEELEIQHIEGTHRPQSTSLNDGKKPMPFIIEGIQCRNSTCHVICALIPMFSKGALPHHTSTVVTVRFLQAGLSKHVLRLLIRPLHATRFTTEQAHLLACLAEQSWEVVPLSV